ncbi:hypothetical protein [Brevibacillus sp. 179-C9.3 HS]|uniref:hypothetical protein n=1 Tax=unclassified Brevibacillus TaxID=2684853 RepID=UPI0039A02DA0
MLGKPFVSKISIGTITSNGILSALKGAFGRNDVVYTVYSPASEKLFKSLHYKESYIQSFRDSLLNVDFEVTILDDSVSLNGRSKNLLFFITNKVNEDDLREILDNFKDSLAVEKVY